MSLPNLPAGDKCRREVRTEWGGINLNENAGDGELIEAMNMSSREYPLLATAWPPEFRLQEESAYAPVMAGSNLHYIVGKQDGYYIRQLGCETDKKLNLAELDLKKVRYAALGTRLVIMPAKQVYDVSDRSLKDMEVVFTNTSTLSIQDGTYGGVPAAGNTIYMSGANWSNKFSVGDAVTISGCVNESNNQTAIIREISGNYLRFYENTFVNESVQANSGFSITRSVPDMDYICVNENRVWGCRGDTIYASKLGDPFNWNVFDGLSTDSWTTETGDPGSFTGCASFQSYPVFFKNSVIYRIVGDEPRNYTIRKINNTYGVVNGSDLSIVEVAGRLLYESPVGIVQWAGADMPTVISSPIGLDYRRWHPERVDGTPASIAGTDGVRYYVSLDYMLGYSEPGIADIEYRLMVYDTRCGTWHEMPDTTDFNRTAFAWNGIDLFMLQDGKDENDHDVRNFYALTGPRPVDTEQPWRVTFADSTRAYKTALTGSESKKGVLRLLIRCKLAGSMKVWIAYDGGEFEEAAEFSETAKTSKVVPLILRRCDFWQLRLTGTGDAVIYSIAVEKYGGEWQQA